MVDEDLELVKRFQSGDTTAFDPLVSKYQKKIYDITFYHTHDAEEAYDLSQEVFEKVFKSLGGFRRKSSFYACMATYRSRKSLKYRSARSIRAWPECNMH